MSYPQFQAASDYLGAIADEDYVKALPSNSYEDRGGAVLDGPEAGYKVTYTQADAEAVTAEDGRVILMDEHLADSDAMDYDMDRADGEWALSDYVQKGIEVMTMNHAHSSVRTQRISCLTGRGTGKQCQIPIALGRFDRHLLDLGWLQNLCIRDRIMPCVVIHVNKKHFCPHRKMRQRAEVTRIVMSRDYQVICI